MPLPVIGSMTTERWFRQRGLVTLLDGTGVESTAGVRAAPALVVIFLVIMLWGVPDLLGVPLLPGALIAIGTIVVTWVLANLARRRRPFAPVARIGWIEALAFVGVPSVLSLFSPTVALEPEDGVPYLPDGMWRVVIAMTSALVLFLILATVYLVVVSGLGSLVSLLVRELLGAVSRTGGTLATVIPVLLGFVFFFFLNPGVWAGIANVDGLSYAALLGFLLTCGGLFVGSQKQFDLAALSTFATTSDLEEALRGTPVEGDPAARLKTPAHCSLRGRQTFNLRLVAVLSRLATASVLAAAVFSVFVILGFIVIGPDTVLAWTKTDPSVLFSLRIGRAEHIVCWQQLRVAGFLATFSGFNYMLVSATDGRLRQDATDAAVVIIRQACALRLVLLTAGQALLSPGEASLGTASLASPEIEGAPPRTS